MYSLTILQQDFEALIATLWRQPEVEGAAYLICGQSVTDGEHRLLVREVVPVEQPEYLRRELLGMTIDSTSYARIAKRALHLGGSVIFVHSHPLGPPDFSGQDDREEPKLMGFLASRLPGRLHGALVVMGSSSMTGRVWAGGGWQPMEVVRVLGTRFGFHYPHAHDAPVPQVFDRNVRAFGEDLQRLLGHLHVGVVGAGGTGSSVAEQLLRLGVGRLSLFDGGLFEGSNATRVYGSRLDDAGRRKSEVLADHLRGVGLGGTVDAHPHINHEDVAKQLRACDVLFGCTDNHTPRALLVQLGLRYLIPVIDLGVKVESSGGQLTGIFGRITTFLPGEACLFCRGRISPQQIALEALTADARRKLVQEKYAPELETNDPAVITFTTAVAAQAVSDFLHRLTGFMGENRRASEVLMMFHDRTFRGNRQSPQAGCFCADRTSWARGDDGGPFLNVTWPSTRAA